MRRSVISKIMVVFVALAFVAILPFKLNADSALAIVTEPDNYVGQIGDTAHFTVEASGEGLTYQWQYDNGKGWKNSGLTGFDTPTLSVKVTEARAGQKYQCVISDGENTVTSRTVTVTILKEFKITSDPADYTGDIGEYALFTVDATGNDLTYQWQYDNGKGWKNSSSAGYNTNTMKVKITEARVGQKYRCIVTDSVYGSATSEAGEIKLKTTPLTLVSSPSDVTGAIGTMAEFTVEATGSGLTYQWQYSKDGITWKNSSSAGYNTPTMSVKITEARNGQKYQCVITDDAGHSVTSGYASIIVSSKVKITFNAGEGTFADGTNERVVEIEPGNFNFKAQEIPQSGDKYFSGWKKADGKAVNYANVKTDMTVYADWMNQYIVTYNANGGTFGDESTSFTDYAIPGSYYVRNDQPEKEGYIFVGWTLNGKAVSDRITISGNVELKAEWAERVIVIYDANGGYWQYGEREADRSFTDERWFVKGIPYFIGNDEAQPERPGYRFDGWKVNNEWTGRITLTEDITAVAQWTKVVTVSFDPNGGEWRWTERDENDNEYVRIEDTVRSWEEDAKPDFWVGESGPMKDGYEFLGWSTNKNATFGREEYEFNLTEDTVFYAVYRKLGIIRYDAGAGFFGHRPDPNENPDENQDQNNEQPYHIKTEYYRAGEITYIRNEWPWMDNDDYDFAGWFDKDGNQMDEEEINVTSATDLTVYAKWIKRVKITYLANGGAFSGFNSQNGETAEKHIRDAREGEEYWLDGWDPDRQGYEFAGWLDEEGNLASDKYILTDADRTFEASWIKIFTITYEGNGGKFNDFDQDRGEDEDTHYRDALDGDNLEIDGWHPDREGYSFIGWSTDPDKMVELPEKVTADITLYAIWYKPAKITYITTMGAWNDNNNYVTTIEREADWDGRCRIDGWSPEVDGPYELIGYATEENGELVYNPGDEIEFVAEDMTLYTVWHKYPTITYKSTNNANIDARFHDGQTEHMEWDNAGYAYYVRHEIPDEPDGYYFIGWKDAAGNFVDDEMIRLEDGKEYVFFAAWEAREKMYRVTYDPNGGTFYPNEGEPDEVSWEAPEGKFDVGCFWPDREGYFFIGWSLNKDDIDAPNEFEIDLNSDVRIYAIWEKLTAVNLDAGEGYLTIWIDGDENEPGHEGTSHYDKYYFRSGTVLPERWISRPEREGYVFDGWVDKSTGSFVNLLNIMNEDIYLEARWIKECEVIFNCNGGQFDNGEVDRILKCNEGDFLSFNWVEEPMKEDCIFAGWAIDNEDGTFTDVYSITVDSDVTLVAIWEPCEA